MLFAGHKKAPFRGLQLAHWLFFSDARGPHEASHEAGHQGHDGVEDRKRKQRDGRDGLHRFWCCRRERREEQRHVDPEDTQQP